MSKELLKHETARTYSSIWMDTLRGGQTQLVNTNKLVRFYKGCIGLKTGTTDGASSCLSAAAERGGKAFFRGRTAHYDRNQRHAAAFCRRA